MRCVNWKSRNVTFLACLFSIALFLAAGCVAPVVVEAQQSAAVTVFEGARLIVGDGSAPVADAAFIVLVQPAFQMLLLGGGIGL
jgi:hypothetical protein